MGLWAKFVALVDSFMVYDTVSVVRIKDKRLAILYYSMMAAIFIYVVVYTIIFQQGYYVHEAPIGTIRINPMAPPNWDEGCIPPPGWKDVKELPYCKRPDHDKYKNFSTLKCLYYDEYFDVFPQALDNTITIATRISRYSQTPNNPYLNDTNATWRDGEYDKYYLADIERFTLQLDHSYFTPSLNISGNARDNTGMLIDKNGKNITHIANTSSLENVGMPGKKDVLSVGTILKAAEIDLDTLVVEAPNNARYTGITVFVIITYTNTKMWNPFYKEPTYTIQAQLLNNTKFKSEQVVYTGNFSEDRVIYDRHGIHFVFLQAGTLSVFSFQVLLLSFVSGVALISAATVVVDVLSTKVLGSRNVITSMKYQETEDLVGLTDEQMELLAEKLISRHRREFGLSSEDKSKNSYEAPLVSSEINSFAEEKMPSEPKDDAEAEAIIASDKV